MPATKTYRQSAGKQRHHKHRVGRMLVPHGRVSGLLFTVNPRQESKALRELQLYLHPLIADLEREDKGVESRSLCAEHCSSTPADVGAERNAAPSTSSLLAAELAEYVPNSVGWNERAQGYGNDKGSYDDDRNNDKSDNNMNNDDEETASASPPLKRQRHDLHGTRRGARDQCCWLAPLDTGCKGYLMVRIPFPAATTTTAAAAAAAAAAVMEREEETYELKGNKDGVMTKAHTLEDTVAHVGSAVSSNAEVRPPSETNGTDPDVARPHSLLHNPLVQIVVERIFKDIEENPRPLLRHCFRLMPCELTCCPTLQEMRAALGRLIDVHFPPLSVGDNDDGNGGGGGTTTATGGMSQRLHCVSFSFNVKNNTNVGNEKAYLKAVLETTFPASRFVIIPASRMKDSDTRLEAVFCILVAHATCVMGVQRLFSQRGEYNLHAIGERHLQLSSSV